MGEGKEEGEEGGERMRDKEAFFSHVPLII
jgi:hypothetical protein